MSKKQHKAKTKLERKCRGFEAIIKFMKHKHQKEIHSLENRVEKQLSDEMEKATKAHAKLEVKIDKQALNKKERSNKLQSR